MYFTSIFPCTYTYSIRKRARKSYASVRYHPSMNFTRHFTSYFTGLYFHYPFSVSCPPTSPPPFFFLLSLRKQNNFYKKKQKAKSKNKFFSNNTAFTPYAQHKPQFTNTAIASATATAITQKTIKNKKRNQSSQSVMYLSNAIFMNGVVFVEQVKEI